MRGPFCRRVESPVGQEAEDEEDAFSESGESGERVCGCWEYEQGEERGYICLSDLIEICIWAFVTGCDWCSSYMLEV